MSHRIFWSGTVNGIIKFQVDLSFENREGKNILNVRDRNYLEGLLLMIAISLK